MFSVATQGSCPISACSAAALIAQLPSKAKPRSFRRSLSFLFFFVAVCPPPGDGRRDSETHRAFLPRSTPTHYVVYAGLLYGECLHLHF